MANLTLLIGLGIFIFTCVYMFFKLSEQKITQELQGEKPTNHFVLQLMILFFILSSVLLLGKVGIDDSNHCDFVVTNSTIVGNVTNNSYDYLCSTNTNSTSFTFYKITLWFMRLLTAYIFIYFTYEVLIYLCWVTPRK